MSELMHHDWSETFVVGGGQCIGVVYASASVFVRIGQDDDVLIVDACQRIMQGFEARGGEVTVGVEGAEVRVEGCVLPLVEARDAHSTVFRGTGHGYDIETLLHRAERFVAEEAFAGHLGVLVEGVHFLFRIAFGQDGYVDAPVGRAALEQVAVGRDVRVSFLVDENVLRIHGVGQAGAYLVMWVEEGDFHHGFSPGIGQEEGILKASVHSACLVRLQPLQEEGGERSAIDDGVACSVAHRNLSVALQGQFCQVVSASCPSWQGGKFVHTDGLVAGVASEEVIHAQCLVREILVKILCAHSRAGQEEREEQVSSFHVDSWFYRRKDTLLSVIYSFLGEKSNKL